jgi:hypothetical protein
LVKSRSRCARLAEWLKSALIFDLTVGSLTKFYRSLRRSFFFLSKCKYINRSKETKLVTQQVNIYNQPKKTKKLTNAYTGKDLTAI